MAILHIGCTVGGTNTACRLPMVYSTVIAWKVTPSNQSLSPDEVLAQISARGRLISTGKA